MAWVRLRAFKPFPGLYARHYDQYEALCSVQPGLTSVIIGFVPIGM